MEPKRPGYRVVVRKEDAKEPGGDTRLLRIRTGAMLADDATLATPLTAAGLCRTATYR